MASTASRTAAFLSRVLQCLAAATESNRKGRSSVKGGMDWPRTAAVVKQAAINAVLHRCECSLPFSIPFAGWLLAVVEAPRGVGVANLIQEPAGDSLNKAGKLHAGPF